MGADDMNGDGQLVPSWSRPPFEPGNDVALQHGGYSRGRWKPRAEAVKAALLAAPGLEYLREPRFALGVDDLCEAQAIGDLLGEWLDEAGIQAAATEVVEASEAESGPPGGTRTRKASSRRTEPVLSLRHRWMGRAANLRRDLGITPASYATIIRDIGVVARQQADAIDRLAAAGKKIRETRERIEAEGRAKGLDPYQYWQAWLAERPGS